MLRFGDGTPFPLDEGFLQVLVDAVSACTAMLTATASMEERHERARQKQQALRDEEHRLERFEQTVRAAAMTSAQAPPRRPTPAEQAARRTVAIMRHAVKHARAQLGRVAAANEAEFGWIEAARQVESVLGGFFERHVLPGMVWSWSWDATPARPSFEATARGARFTADFDLEHDVLWRAPIRLAVLVPGIAIDLPRRRWLRTPAVARTHLDRCVLVGARSDPEGRRLEIQEHAGAAPGWRITLPRDGAPSATAFDRRGRAVAVSPVEPSQLAPLVDAIEQAVRARLDTRHARAVLLGEAPIGRLEETTAAPRALLAELGPIVHEIRTRSRVPGELSIKRDVAAGVREELFVSRAQLAACYASLPPQYRHLLDALGAGRGLTDVLSECATEPTAAVSRPRVPAPVLPRVNAHPPPIPRRPSARTPTQPVRSLRAIPIQDAAPQIRPWIPRRPATPTA